MITEQFVPVAVGFTYHPKLVALRRCGHATYGRALALWLLARLHVEREQTGGVVPDVDLRMIYDAPDVAKLAAALVEAGLWDACEQGFSIHDVESSGGVIVAERSADPEALRANRKAERNRKYRLTHPKRERGKTPSETVGKTREDAPLSDSPPEQDGRDEKEDARETASRETPRDALRDTQASHRVPSWGDLPSLLTPGSQERPWCFVEAAYRRAFKQHTGNKAGGAVHWRADFETLAETLLAHCRETGETEHETLERVLSTHFKTADDFTRKRGFPPKDIGERFGILVGPVKRTGTSNADERAEIEAAKRRAQPKTRPQPEAAE